MNENEELLTATEQASADEQVIELDDVEGHGLREVAAGLGAAAVLAGGGAATAATLGVHPSHPGGPQASATVSNPVGTSDRAVDDALTTARATRDGALATAANTVDGAVASTTRTAADAVAATGRTTGAAVRLTTGTAANTTAAARTVVRTSTTAALQDVDAVAGTTDRTLRSTTTLASGVTSDVTQTADRKVATVLTISTNAVSLTTTQLMITVADLNPQASTGVSTANAGGWVSIQLEGGTLAQVQLVDGQASISLDTKNLVSKTLTLVYSGDAVHASSTRSIAF